MTGEGSCGAEECLGARLRRLRGARGLTPTQLAEALRALGAWPDPDDVLRWEANLAEPELRTFAPLARALGVTMEVLLYGERVAAKIAEERERAQLPQERPEPVAPGAPMTAPGSTEPSAPTRGGPSAFETRVMALVNSGVVFVFLSVLMLSLIVVIIARAILRAWGPW